MAQFDPGTHGELAGDIIAAQITKALESGEPIWRAVGNVLDLFFSHRRIEVNYDPSVTPVYGPGEVPYAPLTKAWQMDPLTELPVAIWFKSGWGLLDWSQIWRSGSLPTFPTKYPGPMTPVGSDDAGNSGQYADGKHSHPANPAPPDPVVQSSSLYTAKVGDPLFKGQAHCCFLGAHGLGDNNPMLEGWVEVSPGVFQYPIPGLLPASFFDGVETSPVNSAGVSQLIGKRVVAFFQGDPSLTGYEEPRQYVFIVDDVGQVKTGEIMGSNTYGDSYARMHRDPDFSYSSAWQTGMKFLIQNGAIYGNGTLTFDNVGAFTLGTTFIDWSWTAGAPAVTEKFEALTGPQLTSEGALTSTIEQQVTLASPSGPGTYAEAEMPHAFITLAGTPGVDSLASGPYKFDVAGIRVSGGDVGSVSLLRARIQDIDGTTGDILIADSAPISNTANASAAFTEYLGSPYAFAPDRRLLIRYYLRTNSVSPVTMTMVYNSASRGTKVTLPFEMPITGSSDGVHGHLSGRDAAEQHPWSALGPLGRAHTAPVTATYSGTTGHITVPADLAAARSANVVRVSITGDVGGITTTGWQDGDLLYLRIVADATLRTIYRNYATFDHGTYPNAAGIRPRFISASRTLQIPANGIMKLLLRLDTVSYGFPVWEQEAAEVVL